MKNGIRIKRFFLVIVSGILTCLIVNGTARTEDTVPEPGEQIYKKHCMVCHGENGEGDGPAARYLYPKPRVLTDGLFKVRSTPSGEPPTDNDIYDIIKNGMPGSSMPSLNELSKEEMEAIVEYVKELGEIEYEPERVIRPGAPPSVTPQLIAEGRKVYKETKCWECHGDEGKGDGLKAKDLKDDWKYPAPPNAFTMGIYKGGGTPSDVYLRFSAGMDGSPMPSYEDALNNEERWALVFYTLSLAGEEVAQQPVGGKIAAKRISEDIPGNPEHDVWKQAVAFKIPLMLLWQKPDSPQRVITVRALSNDSEIAFLMEWKDRTKNSFLDLDAFRDGAALQFPVQGRSKPAFWMGEGPESNEVVNIWFWKADLQEQINKGTQTKSNTPVENLIAGGFGTLTLTGKDSPVFGKGIWKDGKWSVVFKRSFHGAKGSANFATGFRSPIGFAVWDGGEGDVGGRKAVSTWYYVVPERL
jgi:DMSO reductase family type II enzyme heme b subunit